MEGSKLIQMSGTFQIVTPCERADRRDALRPGTPRHCATSDPSRNNYEQCGIVVCRMLYGTLEAVRGMIPSSPAYPGIFRAYCQVTAGQPNPAQGGCPAPGTGPHSLRITSPLTTVRAISPCGPARARSRIPI